MADGDQPDPEDINPNAGLFTGSHAFFMMAGYSVTLTAAMMLGRFIKGNENYIKWHLMVGSLGILLVLIGYLFGFFTAAIRFDTFHGKFGTALLPFTIMEPVIGVIADRMLDRKEMMLNAAGVPKFMPFGAHKFLGWGCMIGSFYAATQGHLLNGIDPNLLRVWYVWCGIAGSALVLTLFARADESLEEARFAAAQEAEDGDFESKVHKRFRDSYKFELPKDFASVEKGGGGHHHRSHSKKKRHR